MAAEGQIRMAASEFLELRYRAQPRSFVQQRHYFLVEDAGQRIRPAPSARLVLLRRRSRIRLDAISGRPADPGLRAATAEATMQIVRQSARSPPDQRVGAVSIARAAHRRVPSRLPNATATLRTPGTHPATFAQFPAPRSRGGTHRYPRPCIRISEREKTPEAWQI